MLLNLLGDSLASANADDLAAWGGSPRRATSRRVVAFILR